jgi:hypothetical protein
MSLCKAFTKKGTPCKLKGLPIYDNLCSIHFDSIIEKELKAGMETNPMCKIAGCKHHTISHEGGYCIDHWIDHQYGFVQNPQQPKPEPKNVGSAGAPENIRITNAFRTLEMEPTYDKEVVKSKFREFLKRPDIRIAFTNVDITPETERARTTFEAIRSAFDYLRSIGRA